MIGVPVSDVQQPANLKQWFLVPRPKAVLLTMALVFLQGAAMAGYAVNGLIQLVRGEYESLMFTVSVLLFVALIAFALFAAVKGMGDQSSWVRGLIITFQLIGILVGLSLVQAGQWYLALPLFAWAGGVLFLMFSKTVNGYVGQRDLPFTSQD